MRSGIDQRQNGQAVACRVFRVPLGIWDKGLWGRRLGGEVLDRLLRFAFAERAADRMCAMSVGRTNHRSLVLFESRGFRAVRDVPAEQAVDLELSRDAYTAGIATAPPNVQLKLTSNLRTLASLTVCFARS